MKTVFFNARKWTRRGMTLMEILVVIVVIGILMGIVGLSAKSSFRNAKITRATVEGRAIAQSLQSYYTAYGYWPSSVLDSDEQDEEGYVKLGGALLDLLRNEGAANPNAVKTVTLEVPDARIRGGFYIDPWTNAYRVAVVPKPATSTNEYILTILPFQFKKR